jgi:hypothetical protein
MLPLPPLVALVVEGLLSEPTGTEWWLGIVLVVALLLELLDCDLFYLLLEL